MFRQLGLPAWVALYVIAIPLAIIVGVSVADPLAPGSLLTLAMIIGLGVAPLVLRFYHESLILAWNSALVIFFLPGRPTLAMALVGLCLLMAVVNRAMVRQPLTLPARTLAVPLIFLGGVILITAMLTGGIGGRAFGGELWGARRYASALFGNLGFFALISRPIAPHRAPLLTAFFMLSATTSALSDIAYAVGWDFLFLILSTDVAFLQAVSEQVGAFVRFTGVCWASWAVFNYLLLRHGIRGLLDFTRPWRGGLAMLALVGTLAGGYRSYIVLTVMLLAMLFYLEGLHRTRLLLATVMVVGLSAAVVLPNVRSLPLAVQRSLSILPVEIDPIAKRDAEGTLDWRLEMWRAVIPDVPKYLLLGKGFAYSGTDYYLTQEAWRRGMIRASYEDTLVSGNYHNGILTLIIPFGIWGMIGFLWFCIAALRALMRNNRYGDPRLQTINRYLLAAFATRLVFYLGVYGQFDLDLASFAGLIGLSIALNHGIARPALAQSEEELKEAAPVDIPGALPVPVAASLPLPRR